MVRCLLPAVAALLIASPLARAGAQSAPSASAAVPSAGPTMTAARLAMGAPVSSSVSAEERQTRPAAVRNTAGFGQPEALMIVGGAAFLAGAIIGGDAGTIVMIGGAGLGLYGLYLYLQ